MLASTIIDIRKALADDKVAATFGRNFVEAYTATAFGVLPKTEIDLLVFALLVQAQVIDPNGSIYRTARALNITPAKTRSLLFQYQLRHVPQDQTDHEVLIAITTARYWKEGERLNFGVASPLVRAAIAAKMQEEGVFSDVSLSGDILRVYPTHFGVFIAALLPKSVAERLTAHLKKKNILSESEVRKIVSDYSAKVAEEFITDVGKERLKTLMTTLGAAVAAHGAPAAVIALAHLVAG